MDKRSAKEIRIIPTVLQALLCGWAILLAQSSVPTASEIIARSVDALGGAAQFATVNAIKVHGRIRFGQEAFKPFIVTAARHRKFRMELSAGPDYVVQAFDGATGWQSVSGQHTQAPAPLTGDALAHLIDQAANAIGGPLLDLEKRGNFAEYAGHEAVNGVECFKLKLTLATRHTMAIFIDPSSYREIQEELPVMIDGEPSTIQQSVGNYRQFGPILIACSFATRQKGKEDSQHMEIDSVEINPVIDDGVFEMPHI